MWKWRFNNNSTLKRFLIKSCSCCKARIGLCWLCFLQTFLVLTSPSLSAWMLFLSHQEPPCRPASSLPAPSFIWLSVLSSLHLCAARLALWRRTIAAFERDSAALRVLRVISFLFGSEESVSSGSAYNSRAPPRGRTTEEGPVGEAEMKRRPRLHLLLQYHSGSASCLCCCWKRRNADMKNFHLFFFLLPGEILFYWIYSF